MSHVEIVDFVIVTGVASLVGLALLGVAALFEKAYDRKELEESHWYLRQRKAERCRRGR